MKPKKIKVVGTLENIEGQNALREVLSKGLIDGTLTFNLYNVPLSASEQVFGNGLLLEKNSDYTLEGNVLTLLPISGTWNNLTVRYNYKGGK